MSMIFIYGRPGKGKTTLAASMTELGYKVLFIDADQKIKNMTHLQPRIKSNQIQIMEINEKLSNSSLRTKILKPDIARVKQPKGYLQFCDILSDLETIAFSDNPTHECQVLTVDSITVIESHLKRLISHIQKKDKFTFDEWEILLSNYEEIFSTLKSLQRLFKHIIVIAHELTEIDEDTKQVTAILPALQGSIRHKFSKDFDEIYRMDSETKKGLPTRYICTTQAINKCDARTSRNIPAIVEANFSIIFADEKDKERTNARTTKS